MSNPRRIVPGTTYLVTRRTTRRYFLLTPDKRRILLAFYWYATAVLAAEFGIEIHAVQMLSNHLHEVLTDTRGRLPDFLSQRNRLLANAIKVLRGWPEEVFSREGASIVALYGEEAVLQKIGYTLANVVEAGLAASPEDWPGVTLAATDIGTRTIRVARPELYLDAENTRWPAAAEISITVPPALEASSGHEGARARIVSAVNAAVEKARIVARKAGKFVRSLAWIFAVPHTTRASSFEKVGARNPSFAAGGNVEMAARALKERAAFLGAYREAFRAMRNAVRDVFFPAGTWRLVRELGVNVISTT
ncbi:MAG: transposase [Myxococcales bacterium]|nr:transposase [Myxococcales bacterium]